MSEGTFCRVEAHILNEFPNATGVQIIELLQNGKLPKKFKHILKYIENITGSVKCISTQGQEKYMCVSGYISKAAVGCICLKKKKIE